MTTIAVTGATGQLGRLIIAALQKQSATVVAIARDAAKAADLPSGVEVRVASYEDPDALAASLLGVDRLIFVSGTEVGRRIAQHGNVVDAASRSGVHHIIYTSAPHVDNEALPVGPDHWATEQLIAGSGLTYTILRNNWYNENYVGQLGVAAATGELVGSAGEGRIASAARLDYAEAAAVVATSEGHENAVYELAGDVAWTMADLAVAVGTILDRPVTYRGLSADEQGSALRAAGLDEGTVGFVVSMDAAISAGGLADNSTGELRRLIRRPTTPLIDTLRSARPIRR